MIEILLKIDGENVSINSETVSDEVAQELVPKASNKSAYRRDKRVYDDFMYNGLQYFRIGEIYGFINLDNELRLIANSTYYNNRKRLTDASQ